MNRKQSQLWMHNVLHCKSLPSWSADAIKKKILLRYVLKQKPLEISQYKNLIILNYNSYKTFTHHASQTKIKQLKSIKGKADQTHTKFK